MKKNYLIACISLIVLGLFLMVDQARAQSPGIGFVIPEKPLAYLEDSVDRAYYIPVQCVGTIPKDSVLSVSVTVMKGSTAQSPLDFQLDAAPPKLLFDNRTAAVQYIRLVVKADTLMDAKETLTLLLQGQDAFSRASIVTSDDRITVQIGDRSEKKPALDPFTYLSKFNYPLRFSLGTSLNVIDKDKVGSNIYFDVLALDQDIVDVLWGSMKDASPDGKHFKKYGSVCPKSHNPHFGGYFRVTQEQGVAVMNERVVPLGFQRPISKQVGRLAADSTLSVEREYFNYKLTSTTVRSSGVALGFNRLAYSSPAAGRSECRISLGLHGELIKREILSTYEKTTVLKDTVRMKSAAYLRDQARGEMDLPQRINSFDGYVGLSSTVLYRFGDVEFIAIPSVGFVGTTLDDNDPTKGVFQNNFYMNVYAVITERKFGFTLGCDLKTVPGNNTINSFNIFANKAFSLEKVAEALRFN